MATTSHDEDDTMQDDGVDAQLHNDSLLLETAVIAEETPATLVHAEHIVGIFWDLCQYSQANSLLQTSTHYNSD